ncbi:hypothetical protein ACWERV_12850 [Streptomyces sp. NPDC004031]
MRGRHLGAAATALCCALGAVSGCARAEPTRAETARTGASFTDGGVTVHVTLERSGPTTVEVTATLRPQRPGFHLYSLSLPDGGVDGLGIPTRLAVSPPLTPSAPATASARPYALRLPELDVTLPVYPDGPVVLHLPARLPSASPGTTAHLRLTYGACSTTEGCLVPVRDHPLTLALPGG